MQTARYGNHYRISDWYTLLEQGPSVHDLFVNQRRILSGMDLISVYVYLNAIIEEKDFIEDSTSVRSGYAYIHMREEPLRERSMVDASWSITWPYLVQENQQRAVRSDLFCGTRRMLRAASYAAIEIYLAIHLLESETVAVREQEVILTYTQFHACLQEQEQTRRGSHR